MIARWIPAPRRDADFACPEEKLVVELDGGQHVERKDKDAARTRWLADRGYRVLRFWNNDVLTRPPCLAVLHNATVRGGPLISRVQDVDEVA